MKILHIFTQVSTPRVFFDGQFKYLADEGGHVIHLATTSDEDIDFSKRNNLNYHQIEIARKIDIKTDLKSIREIHKLIKKEKFDVVVGHTPKGALIAMIAAKLSGVKNRVYYRHGFIYTTATGLKRKLFMAIEKLTSSLATKVVNVSPSIAKLAVKDGLTKEKKQVVFGLGTCGGIDTKGRFNPELVSEKTKEVLRNKFGITKSDFIIGYCGRFCKEKGTRELIDGFISFRKNNIGLNPKLLLIGYYDNRDHLPERYKNLIDIDKDIILAGRISNSKLAPFYSLVNAFVFPSYREGFGMTVIEASAMGIPVLVSKSHGCLDSIKENETGEYIEISAEGIEKGLESMKDSEKRKRFGGNGRKFVVENFDHTVLWPQILEFYKIFK